MEDDQQWSEFVKLAKQIEQLQEDIKAKDTVLNSSVNAYNRMWKKYQDEFEENKKLKEENNRLKGLLKKMITIDNFYLKTKTRDKIFKELLEKNNIKL